MKKTIIKKVNMPKKLLSKIKNKSLIYKNLTIDKLNKKPISYNRQPIFIVACGHSGTTLMTAILNAHPNLFAISYETELFKYINSRKVIEKEIDRFYNETQKNNASRFVEKTPRHVYKISRILKYYPNARIIAMIRDGRDVASSIKKRTGSFEDGVERWKSDNRELIRYLIDTRVLLLKYEDLIENFKGSMQQVANFVGEDYVEEFENHNKKKYDYFNIGDAQKPENAFGENHNEYRAWQVNQPIYDARNRWRQELTQSEIDFFKEEANDLLIYFNYERTSNW